MPLKQTTGSRAQVMHGNAKKTSGGLTKAQLKYNKQGKIVSRKASTLAKKNNRLVKAGYVTRKGQFGVSMKGGVLNTNQQQKIEEFARGLGKNERKYVNARQAQKAQFYTMNGETKSFPIASVSNTLPALMEWLDSQHVLVFRTGVEIPLKDTYILNANEKYFVLPRDPILDKQLIEASRVGDLDKVRNLLDRKVDANAVDNTKWTPLHFASSYGHTAVVDLLIKAGAGVHAVNNGGQTALHCASQKGHTAVVDLLIKAGAGLNEEDVFDETPLHCASQKGHAAVVDLLIKAGADANAVNDRGQTPLHYASLSGHDAVAELLLAAGADVHAVNDRGNTPLQLATRSINNPVANLIRKHVANQSK